MVSRRSAANGAPRSPVRPRGKPSPYEKVKQAIMSGELGPGDPLVEIALAEWCEVSRTPIREALRRLEQDGLVVRGERGLSVREQSPDEILDLYETRIALEGAAARIAAERRTTTDLLFMRRSLEQMRTMATDDPDAMAAANGEFHRAIWAAGRNLSLIDLLERLGLHLGRYPATTLSFPGRWETSNKEHAELVDAIEARDDALAFTLATAHFSAARDIRLKILQAEF